MVRLKAVVEVVPVNVVEFQFHYGTIKSGGCNTLDHRALFQFHYGTIKRRIQS